MKRKIRKGRNLLVMGIFILTFLLIPQSAVAAGETGSLTVYYHGITPQGNQTVLSGAEFSLYKAGKKEQNEWKLQGAFESSGVDLTDMSSSGQRKAAEQLYDFAVKQNPEGEVSTTGYDGKAFFYNLEEGMYLCVSDDEISCESGVFRSAPFLVFIPEIDENGNCFYDVTVEPKNEWVSDEENPEKKPGANTEESPSKEEDVKTGDDTPIAKLIKTLAVSVIVTILLMFWENRKKTKFM